MIQQGGSTMKITKIYVVEYRYYDKNTDSWISHVSQDGYRNYSDARRFCEKRASNAGRTQMPMYFQNISFNNIFEEYYIHEVVLR